MVHPGERAARGGFERQNGHKKPLGSRVEVADWVGDEWAAYAGGAIDRWDVAKERVEIDRVMNRRVGRQQRAAALVVDVEHIVDRLDDLPISNTQRLVGRLDGELITTAREALIAEVQSVEAG